MEVTPIIPEGEPITLKEFKAKIKGIGYKYKTHVVCGFSKAHRCLEILDKDGKFVVGSGGNVYVHEDIVKHQPAFDLIRKYKGRVFDEEGDKVLF